MGDAAVLLRLALGETDLHAVSLELDPAAVRIDVRLVEPELARVERTAGLEVSHLVPDGRQSARPGSSRNALTSRRNSAAVAPSIARWSHVRVSSIRGRTTGWPST